MIGENCILIPTVRTKDGAIVNSSLFVALQSTYGREVAKEVYTRVITDKFKQDFKDKLKFDSLGEPMLGSLEEIPMVRKFIGNERYKNVLAKRYEFDKKFTPSESSLSEIFANMSKFRSNVDKSITSNYVTIIDKDEDNNIFVKLVEKNQENIELAKKQRKGFEILQEMKKNLLQTNIDNNVIEKAFEKTNEHVLNNVMEAEDILEDIRSINGNYKDISLSTNFIPNLIVEKSKNDSSLARINKIKNYIIQNNLIENFELLSNEEQESKLDEKVAELIKNYVNELGTYDDEIGRTIKTLIKNIKSSLKIKDSTLVDIRDKASDLANNIITDNPTNTKRLNDYKKQAVKELEDVNDDVKIVIETIDKKVKEIAKKIIEQENVRYVIYSRTKGNKKFKQKQKNLLHELRSTADPLYVVSKFLSHAIDQLNSLTNATKNRDFPNNNEKGKFYENVRLYLASYKPLFEICNNLVNTNENVWKNILITKDGKNLSIQEVLDKCTLAMNRLENIYKYENKNIVKDSPLKDFYENISPQSMGREIGKKFNLEEEIENGPAKDISVVERWALPASDSYNLIIQGSEKMIHEANQNARLQNIEDSKLIQAADQKLKIAGIRDKDFMFVKKPDGTIDRKYYLSEYDYRKYYAARQEREDKIKEQFAKSYGEDRKKWDVATEKIYKNTLKRACKDIRLKNFLSDDYKQLMSDNSTEGKAKREYYNTFMNLYHKYVEFLPEGMTTTNHSIKILKDDLERLKTAKSFAEVKSILKAKGRDMFRRTSQDTDMLEGDNTITNFAGEEMMFIPVYYTSLIGKDDPNDISTDTTANLIAFGFMANYHNEAGKIQGNLFAIQDYLNNLAVPEGKKKQVFNRGTSEETERKVLKKPGNSRIAARFNDLMAAQFYHRYYRDEGNIKGTNIPVTKAVNALLTFTAHKGYALNLQAGITNVTVGSAMINVEAICGQFYNESEKFEADGKYFKYLGDYLLETGKEVKTSFLYLLDETFNIMQDYDKKVSLNNFDRNTRLGRMISSSLLFLASEAGEHWLQHRTALAMLIRHQVLLNGKKVSLIDALEKKYVDDNRHELGARLVLKQGVTDLNGNEINFKELVKQKENQIKKINQDLHGIYNKEDMLALQRTSIGRLAILYRRYLMPSLTRRFANAQYRYLLDGTPSEYKKHLFGEAEEYIHDGWTEGYYQTLYYFVKDQIKDLRQHQFAIATSWKDLTLPQKANIRRAITELTSVIALGTLIALMDFKDLKNKPWYLKTLIYQANRTYMELSALTPSKDMLQNFGKLLNSPTATLNSFNDCINLLDLVNPHKWTHVMQSGQFEGYPEAVKSGVKAMPWGNTLYRSLHPELGMSYLQAGLL